MIINYNINDDNDSNDKQDNDRLKIMIIDIDDNVSSCDTIAFDQIVAGNPHHHQTL